VREFIVPVCAETCVTTINSAPPPEKHRPEMAGRAADRAHQNRVAKSGCKVNGYCPLGRFIDEEAVAKAVAGLLATVDIGIGEFA